MKWYEIVILIFIVFLGIYVKSKFKKNAYNNYNDSWKNRK